MNRKKVYSQDDMFSIPLEREIVSPRQAYINLFAAIRAQAIKDNRLDVWETFWMYSPEMQNTWRLFSSALNIQQRTGVPDTRLHT